MTAASGPRALPAALRGALWMGGALLSFCIMAVAVRELLRSMGAFEILFLRSLVSLLLVLAVLPYFGLRALRECRARRQRERERHSCDAEYYFHELLHEHGES